MAETEKQDGDPKGTFEGLEIGAVSIKWVRRDRQGGTLVEIERHEGRPEERIKEILGRHETGGTSRVVVTGQAARLLMDLPYRSETECIEQALSFHDLKPDILLSLGGETFSVYPLKNGR